MEPLRASIYAAQRFRESIADKKLFAVVTADPGCGKSTLLRKFNDRLPKDEYILCTCRTPS